MELDGQPVHVRSAPPRGEHPVLYVHGSPTSGADWAPFLERTGGVAPDLPGFGRSGKSGEHAYDLPFYDRWIEHFADAQGLDRVVLVVHDWGALALQWAARQPERIERLVVLDAVPLLPGYTWHRWARVWRTPVLGELAMGATTRFVINRSLPRPVADVVNDGFDLGTQRAILRLYRSADPEALETAGRDLRRLRDVRSLVIWGGRDPYIGEAFAHAYADVLDAELHVTREAGHWPWVQDPEVVDRVASFTLGAS